jgi:oligopeptide transport system substrate-binding protein
MANWLEMILMAILAKALWGRKALWLKGCFVLLCCVGLTGCQSGPKGLPVPPQAAGVVRLNLGSEPPTLDPIKVTDLSSLAVVNQLMVGLTRFNGQSEVVPGLATHWAISPDRKTYTFWLNPKATWHDGQPVTAQHVADGLHRALTPTNGSEYAFFLFGIEQAQAFFEGKQTQFNRVGIRVLGPHQLRIQLNKPQAFFTSLLAFPVAYPARLDVVTRYGDGWTEAGHFVGNGPYTLAYWRHDDRLQLKPNAHWWLGQPPRVTGVDWVMVNDANTSMVLYDNNQLDMVESPTTLPSFEIRRIQHRPDFTQSGLAVIHYLGFNTQKPPFNNVKVRQAFAYALDRQTFTQLLQAGQTPVQGFVTPGMPGYNPALGIPFNLTKAKALLAEAGYPGGKGFPAVTLAFRSLYDVRKEAEIAQYLWQQGLGVTVKLQNMDWKVLLNQLKTDPPHLFKLNWYVDYPDPDSFLSLFTQANGNNYTRWVLPAYDALVANAASMSPGPQRDAAYQQLQTMLLTQHTVIVPVYTVNKSRLQNPALQGVNINSLNLLDLSTACKPLSAQAPPCP